MAGTDLIITLNSDLQGKTLEFFLPNPSLSFYWCQMFSIYSVFNNREKISVPKMFDNY